MVTRLLSASVLLCSCCQIFSVLLFLYAIVSVLSRTPPPWGRSFLTALGAAARVHPTFWFSSPPTPHLGFKFKGTLKEALCDWAVTIQGTVTTWAELLHQPISLATRHSMYGRLWVRPQFSVQSAVAGEAGLRVTCVTAGL